jgi:hypothetical protein
VAEHAIISVVNPGWVSIALLTVCMFVGRVRYLVVNEDVRVNDELVVLEVADPLRVPALKQAEDPMLIDELLDPK